MSLFASECTLKGTGPGEVSCEGKVRHGREQRQSKRRNGSGVHCAFLPGRWGALIAGKKFKKGEKHPGMAEAWAEHHKMKGGASDVDVAEWRRWCEEIGQT